MYKFKRILVGLDLSELDEGLIRYTSFINKIVKPDHIYFMHIIKDIDLPEEIKKEFPGINTSVDERIRESIEENIKNNFEKPEKISIEIKDGSPADKILKWAGIKEIDLMVMGSKKELKGSGILPGKIVKLSHCSVLLVPENPKLEVKKILVPIDFSEHSKMALEEAQEISEATGASLICHHSYAVPSGYHTSGKSFEEFAEIMKGHAEKNFTEFLKKSNLSAAIPCFFTLDEHNDPAEQAFEVASKEKVDLIVIGSKGRKSIANIILGSVADKMTQYDKELPLMVVKNKVENLSFFQALMRL